MQIRALIFVVTGNLHKFEEQCFPHCFTSSFFSNRHFSTSKKMAALNLSSIFEADSKFIKSSVRSTIKAAMNPSNPCVHLTSIKIDFSSGPLLTAADPRYVYR